MTRRIWWLTSIVLGVGLLWVALGSDACAWEGWREGACPLEIPACTALVAAGPGTRTFLDRSWKALGILVYPGLIEIRDPYTGRITGRVDAPGGRRFTGLPALSPDGRLVAATVDDGTLRVWEVGSGREVGTLPSCTEGGSASFRPRGAGPRCARFRRRSAPMGHRHRHTDHGAPGVRTVHAGARRRVQSRWPVVGGSDPVVGARALRGAGRPGLRGVGYEDRPRGPGVPRVGGGATERVTRWAVHRVRPCRRDDPVLAAWRRTGGGRAQPQGRAGSRR